MKSNTTVKKTLKTIVWVVVANGLVAGLAYVTGHSDLFNPTVVSFANVALVAAKNLADPKVKNI